MESTEVVFPLPGGWLGVRNSTTEFLLVVERRASCKHCKQDLTVETRG